VADLTEPRDLFGIALTTGDFDGDGRAELAVGVSGETLNDLTSPIGEVGMVHVLPGSPGGLTGSGSQLWSQDSPGVAGAPEFLDFFGQTMAASDPSAAEASPGARAATPAASSRPTPPHDADRHRRASRPPARPDQMRPRC
jgi:hypothetical protein